MQTTIAPLSRIFDWGLAYVANQSLEKGEPGDMRLVGDLSVRTREGSNVRGSVTVVPNISVDMDEPGIALAIAAW